MEYYNLLYTKELSNIRNDSLKNKENWFILVHFLNHLTAPPISPIFIHLSIRLR